MEQQRVHDQRISSLGVDGSTTPARHTGREPLGWYEAAPMSAVENPQSSGIGRTVIEMDTDGGAAA